MGWGGVGGVSFQATAAGASPTILFIKTDHTSANYSPAVSPVLPYYINSIPSGISNVGISSLAEKLSKDSVIKVFGTSTATAIATARLAFDLSVLS